MVDDVELVLFESEEFGGNMPDLGQLQDLNQLAVEHELTYTVHLPLDLCLGGGDGEEDRSIQQAKRVIDITRQLHPEAYTLHLDGRAIMRSGDPAVTEKWLSATGEALALLCDHVAEPSKLCIENVEAWDPEVFAPLLDELPVSRTIDVGHFWLCGEDPMEHLRRWIDRTKIIHLHGVVERDHASLAAVRGSELDRVVCFLLSRFTGIVTLEVFNMADLTSSIEALNSSIDRIAGRQ